MATGLYAGTTISEETVALVREAMGDATRAVTLASGMIGYELETPAKIIVPVITPLVNMLPRRKGAGTDIVHWKAITSFDTARNWGVMADGGTPSQVTYAVASLQNTMQAIGLMNAVTFQAQWRGRGLESDVRARRVAELLYQLKMTEERWLLGASASLMVPPAPVLVTATSGTALSTVASNTAKTFVDGSGNVLMWDGIIAQALNNASQANGATLGAQVAQPAGADGKLALSDIDNLLASMYLQAAGDPDCIVMNPLDNVRLTNLVVAAGQLRYVLQVGDGADQGQLTAQYRVTRYLNKSTGKEIPILLDRYCPQGQMVFLPLSVPFPVPEIGNAVEIETNQEYWGVDFAITDSNYRFSAFRLVASRCVMRLRFFLTSGSYSIHDHRA